MARLVLEQLSDFGDYTGSNELTDMFQASDNEAKSPLSNVRLSPEGRHVHIIQRKPHVGLVTLDQHERPQLIHNHKRQDLRPARAAPIVDVLYLAATTAAVVYEDGKAEFWRFQPCRGGWRLLQTSELCNSPRARVVSVCASGTLVVWCEERPPSESSPALGSARNKLRYCVCRREVEVAEAAVVLGGVKITLHNNPRFTLVGSGERVHLLPDPRARPLRSISGFILSWSPRHDSFTVSTACKNTPLKTAKESDFKRLVVDCLGYLSARDPPDIQNFSATACGGLLLLFTTGWVCHLQRDGVLRKVYKALEGDWCARTQLHLYRDTLALLMEKTLRLVDVRTGKELETISLKKDGVLYVNQAKRSTPHLFTPTGLFAVVQKEPDDGHPTKMKPSNTERVHGGALLVEAVFEEACKYYQQRSLSRTQLNVDALKRGGKFQAPISLASILRDYINTGGRQSDPAAAAEDKLAASVEAELKALASLEEAKGRLVRGGVAEVEAACESLVEAEVTRLLSSPELDADALLHLNSIFLLFPGQAWRAAQLALRLHGNGEGVLSSKAPTDVWKTVLSPADVPNNRRSEPDTALPVFELLCRSLLRFQPGWLPGFLALAQQQHVSAGLGLSVSSPSSSSSSSTTGSWSGTPLYKRALGVLSRDKAQHQDLEVELLLVSGRPNAILQALRVLMAKQQWEKVTRVAQEFCTQSPLLNKEIFTTLLCEVAQHRDLDPYLELLWALCPEDVGVTAILNLVLKNLSSPNTSPSSPSSSSFALYSVSSSQPAPFADPQGGQLTIGLLKPLLRRVLQREAKPSQHYADILQSPSFPPPAPPRQPTTTTTAPNSDLLVSSSPPCNNISAFLLNEQQPPMPSADPV